MNRPKLNAFTAAFIEAAYWTDTGEISDGQPPYNAEISVEAYTKAIHDCTSFQTVAADVLAKVYEEHSYDEAQAGHDFWLTRNGHGVGFWDRNLGDDGDKLTELCKEFRELTLYQGDNGLLYFM